MDNFISISSLRSNTSQPQYSKPVEVTNINASKKNVVKDSFVLNSDTNKYELKLANTDSKNNSSSKKVFVGLSLAGVVAALSSLLFIKGKVFSPAKFREHINFTPAKTMSEAVEFAKQNFGIKVFDFKDDLVMANWVNSGLTKVNNRFKGKVNIPPIFRWAKDSEIQEKKKIWGEYFIAWTDAFSKRANNSVIFNPNTIGAKIGFVQGSGKNTHDVLTHELGHYLHSLNISFFDDTFGRLAGRNVSAFKENKTQQAIASKISEYATTSPKEFIAECFSYMCAGKTLPEDVLQMYKHFKGPKLS